MVSPIRCEGLDCVRNWTDIFNVTRVYELNVTIFLNSDDFFEMIKINYPMCDRVKKFALKLCNYNQLACKTYKIT
ncbi:hypothetical protein Sta7437_0793 [Stanieria cyanosphaera PCC 7437]|uniref:Uncharacterized protein n=1 Tax=Stanieria cyanosphaera (strain ATCC 29371 / PCC 7437) TaxID=111780 RepID=K9XQL9_STAC7|nr:hypothetical protein Sta7437_0793 [Stanieria cyanosphaera PCC 7437]